MLHAAACDVIEQHKICVINVKQARFLLSLDTEVMWDGSDRPLAPPRRRTNEPRIQCTAMLSTVGMFSSRRENRARASSATFVSTYRCHRALRKEYATLWVPYVCVVLTQLQHHGVNLGRTPARPPDHRRAS